MAVVTGDRSRTESGTTPAYEPAAVLPSIPAALTHWSACRWRAAEPFAASWEALRRADEILVSCRGSGSGPRPVQAMRDTAAARGLAGDFRGCGCVGSCCRRGLVLRGVGWRRRRLSRRGRGRNLILCSRCAFRAGVRYGLLMRAVNWQGLSVRCGGSEQWRRCSTTGAA